jgi:hypothetical protein
MGSFSAAQHRPHHGPPQWADLGMFVQTVMLPARGEGRHTCSIEAWTKPPKRATLPTLFLMLQAKRARLAAIAAGNPESLRRVRDTSGNHTASVQAVRALESMRDRMDEAAGVRASLPTPGVVIVIEAPDGRTVCTVGPAPPVIDARPAIPSDPQEPAA